VAKKPVCSQWLYTVLENGLGVLLLLSTCPGCISHILCLQVWDPVALQGRAASAGATFLHPREWALQVTDNPKARGAFHRSCLGPRRWRAFIAATTGQVTFMSTEFTQEEEFSYSVDHSIPCYIGVV